MVSGFDKAKVSAAKLLAGRIAFVEVTFPDDAVFPGTRQTAQRAGKLRLSAPGWSAVNDWSAHELSEKTRLQPRIGVYEDGRLVSGEEPK